MDHALKQTRATTIDDLYMFKFRTKRCTRQRQCKDPSRCFDAHSNLMKRRVPKQVWSKGGLFNYIPEPCPEWQRSKKCCLGDSCTRSHGWLEMIYHPLLYKTKLCKSKRQNGACIEYGMYCAKAHARSEIRCLVDIYGENWKQHYDLLDNLRGTNNNRLSRNNSILTQLRGFTKGRVGLAVPPKVQHVIDLNLFAQYLLDRNISPREQPPICVVDRSEVGEIPKKSHSLFGNLCSGAGVSRYPFGNSEFAVEKEDITSYNQLFMSNCGSDKNDRGYCDPEDDDFVRPLKGVQSLIRPTPAVCMALSSSANLVYDGYGNNKSFFSGEHGKGPLHSLISDHNNLLSSQRIFKRDTGSILDKVFQSV